MRRSDSSDIDSRSYHVSHELVNRLQDENSADRAESHPALLRAELKELPPTRPPLRPASAGPAPIGPRACTTWGVRERLVRHGGQEGMQLWSSSAKGIPGGGGP